MRSYLGSASSRGGMGGGLLMLVMVGTCTGAAFDITALIHQYEDDILGGRRGVPSAEDYQQHEANEGDDGHPVEAHGWGNNLKLGQVSAVDVDNNNDPVIFHRGPITWNGKSFNLNNKLVNENVIKEDTILTLDQDTGMIKHGWGANMFYMPHGLTVDHEGNTWVTDVGLHQVFKFPPGEFKNPSLVLGEKFVPGSDSKHFCKPTSVAVSKSGVVFVADGYCNNRVMVFDSNGRNLNRTITGPWAVVHSLVLFEAEDVLCVADREGERIQCVMAGLAAPQLTGSLIETLDAISLKQRLGRMFAIAGRGTALLAVNGPGWGKSDPPVRGITVDMTDEPRIVDTWGEGLKNPHDVAISINGEAIYVAEIGPNTIRKFEVVVPQDDLF